ncbi:MAG TPA: thymidine kinase [Cryomorphaceae bacterium]|nr:MAG: thymidine kinase [Cryomorphaceae bacterium BACL7 MAG-120910-bin2]KRO68364.1 MAG: thymidine kinase [Cryomorphaceae bacterium BACL7 MAG-120322-bin74]NQW25590.1 thymidine kinase [Cryomorphaceae bacterium]HAG48361.1 thymidine kinase [Cryomorphaceae bacterium]
MFQEHTEVPTRRSGWIEVIAGSMFSGKTEELIRRAKRAQIAKLSVQIFKPGIDTRYAEDAVVTHDRASLDCQVVQSSDQLHLLAAGYDVVGIDEAQFMDEGIVEVVNALANAGTRVIIAGLDMDFSGKPFGPMPQLMAVAEFVTKVHAICVRTGELAHYSHRLEAGQGTILLGSQSEYEPLSRAIFSKIQAEQTNDVPGHSD